jgi:hypothetical protein
VSVHVVFCAVDHICREEQVATCHKLPGEVSMVITDILVQIFFSQMDF